MNRPTRTEIMGCSVYCMTDDPVAAQLWEELMLREPVQKAGVWEETPSERGARILKERELMLPITNRNAKLNRLLSEKSFDVNITIVRRGYADCMYETKGQFCYRACQRGSDLMSVIRGTVKYDENCELIIDEYDGDIPMNEEKLGQFTEEVCERVFDPTVVSDTDCDYIIYRERDCRVQKLIEDAKDYRWLSRRVG